MGTNPSSIDHIITNMTSLFMKSCTAETGISDYHKLIMSIYRMTYAKSKGKKLFCCCFKNFNSKFLKEVLIKHFSQTELSQSFETTLEKFALLKQKYLRYNNNHFMNRTLIKAIMTRSKLNGGTT